MHVSRRLPRRAFLALAAAAGVAPALAFDASAWERVRAAASGATVRFNAWAGSEQINAYLQWAAGELRRRDGIVFEHVKIADTAEVVRRIRTEKQAGRLRDGSADMVWINGENFAVMKREGLLHGPFAEALPSYGAVDTVGKPTTTVDFGIPVDGMEAPWGMAQLTFFGERRRLAELPRSLAEFTALARRNPGRLSYPRPPDFHGTTFLKQVLLESVPDRKPFAFAMPPSGVDALLAPLWAALDALHPHLWRAGRQFPRDAASLRQMVADGEALVGLTFNPNEAANEIAAKRLPATVVSWQHSGGTVGNTHFLAVPFNAPSRDAALVAIDFLLSPAAQARKADIRVWGDPTVLALDRLPAPERARFAAVAAPGVVEQPAPALPEPQAGWVEILEREWLRRYGR